MINGFHSIIHSGAAEAKRVFFRDVLERLRIGERGGWLIVKTPSTGMGVPPSEGPDGEQWGTVPTHRLGLMCDHMEGDGGRVARQGVSVVDAVVDEDFGLTATIEVPGAGGMMLYEPRHALAHALPD